MVVRSKCWGRVSVATLGIFIGGGGCGPRDSVPIGVQGWSPARCPQKLKQLQALFTDFDYRGDQNLKTSVQLTHGIPDSWPVVGFYPNVTTLRSGLCCRNSVCRLSSVCNVGAPYSGGWSFQQYFFSAVYAGHPLTSMQNFTEIVLGEPLRRER